MCNSPYRKQRPEARFAAVAALRCKKISASARKNPNNIIRDFARGCKGIEKEK
jgi:hypothetical protein